MKRGRLTGLAIAAAGVIGIGSWAAAGAADQSSAGRWATPAAERVAVHTMPPPATTAAKAAGRKPTGEPRAGSGTSAAAKPKAPEPFVQRFAEQRGVTKQRPKRSGKPVKVAATVDGCDRNYGTDAQCIPLKFPGKSPDKCAWLREHGYEKVKVAGKDRQALDPDRNGIACD